VKSHRYVWTRPGCAVILFNVFLFTAAASGQLVVNPSNVNFGNVQIGQSASQSVALTNSSDRNLTITQATPSGAGFGVSGIILPVTLTPGQGVSLTAIFAPQSSGTVSGNIILDFYRPWAKRRSEISTVPLAGTGITAGTLSVNPSSINFGSVQIGNQPTASATLSNTGTASLTVSQATLTGTGFTMSGLSLPLTLGGGQSTAFSVTFAPQSPGGASGNVAFTSNASDSTLNFPLSGTGVTQGKLTANPASLAFGNVQVGTSTSLTETLSNSGGTSLTISAAAASGPGFSLSGLALPLTLTPGQSTSFTVVFDPAASGAVSGSVNITSTASDSSLSIALSGTGASAGSLSANPTTLGFGNVQVGNSANLSETVTNTGGSSVIISQANVSGTGFSISGLNLPITLTASQSVTFTATFKPTAAGAASGSLSVVSNASNSPLNIGLSGTGTAAGTLAVSPTSLSFGNVVVGASSSLTGTLTAGGAAVTISSDGISNSEFVVSGISLPATISAGQSANFTVTFTPQASGATSASLSFASNASNSPTTQSMTGTGTSPTQHVVDLSWTASPDVIGYNIYRSTVSGGPYTMINTALDSATTYNDNTVASGTTYYYVVTAVNAESEDSGYSNQTEAVVPNP